MSDARWTPWKGGEAAIGRPHALGRAVELLPRRLGLLLRGIAALHGGSRRDVAAVAAAARAAGDRDVALILEVALADPASIDPTEVRKRAKTEQVDDRATLPVLDLIRSFAVYRSGAEAPPTAPLRAAARGRVALPVVLETLTTRSERMYCNRELERVLPRAAQIMTAARAVRVMGSVPRGSIALNYGHDLIQVEAWSGASGEPQVLAARARGEEPWTNGHDPVSEWLYAQPAAERRAWLGPLVHAVAARVCAGAFDGAVGLVHAAWHLAEAPALRAQLSLLENQINWIRARGPHDPVIAEAIWTSRPKLSAEDRLVLARALVMHLAADPSPEVSRAAAAHLAAFCRDAGDVTQAFDVLLDERAPLGESVRRVGGSAGRIAAAEAWAAAEASRGEAALSQIPAMCAAGEVELASLIVARLTAVPAGLAHAEAARAFAGAFRGGLPALDGLHELSRAPGGLPQEARAVVVAALGAEAPEVVGRAIAVAVVVGEEAAAQQRIVEEGRRVRVAVGAEPRVAAIVAGAFGSAEGVPDEVAAAVQPLVQFLLRNGPAAAERAMSGLPPGQHVGGLTFYLRNAEALEVHPRWLERVRGWLLAHEPLLRDLAVEDLAPALQLARPRSLLALVDSVSGLRDDPAWDDLYEDVL